MILIVGMKRKELAKLGEALRAKRESKGMTQMDLAEKANVNRNYIGMLERGERNPSYLTLLKIAEGLNTKLYNLFK